MEFYSARTLFIVGLVLMLLYAAISIFVNIVIIAFIGFILMLIGLYGLSQHFGRPDVFRNMLYSVIIGIVGAVLFAILFAVSLVGGGTYTTAVAVLAVIFVISAFFYRRAFVGLAEASGDSSFKTAGTFAFIAALFNAMVTIAFFALATDMEAAFPAFLLATAVGAILAVIGYIFALVGAVGLKPPAAQAG